MNGKSPKEQLPDEQLMSSFQNGDRDGFRLLFLRYFDSLTRYAAVLGQPSGKAQDIVQEAFLKVFIHRDSFNPAKPFKNWVLTILRRLIIDEFRRKKVPQVPIDEKSLARNGIPDPENPGIGLEIPENSQDVPILNGLKPLVREVVFLRIVEEFTYKEIAQMTGLREDNLRKIVARCLTQIRQGIEKNGLHSISKMA